MHSCRQAFTLIDLLVVISIIALLTSMLLPAIKVARDMAWSTRCHSNLRQIHMGYQAYAADWDGCLAPYTIGLKSGFQMISEYLDETENAASKAADNGVIRGCPTWKQSSKYDASNPIANSWWASTGYGINHFATADGLGGTNDKRHSNMTTATWTGGIATIFSLASIRQQTRRCLVGCATNTSITPWDPTGQKLSPYAAFESEGRHRGNQNMVFFDGHTGKLDHGPGTSQAEMAVLSPQLLP
jgi:prepilin-type processing-associated H-X9-DG protein